MILCCGESLIDMVPENGMYRPLPGGSVYNTAIALGRLGAQTSYLWPLSQDAFGDMLRGPLEEAGVDLSLSPSSHRPTTLALVFLNNGNATYSFYDDGTAGRMFESAALPALPEELGALFIGGISLIQDPCGGAVEEIAHRASESGKVVSVDLNIRPGLVNDERAIRERYSRLLHIADIVKISDEDAAWLFPDAAPGDTAARLLDLGPKLILRTHGSDGSTAIHASGSFNHPARKVEVADTIGAGDTFNAGILTSLAETGSLSKDGLDAITEEYIRAALELAARAAAITVSRPGANPPWRRELD
ncbi:carbohydrate kinase [Paracoccus aurantiacus]|uniref:Carbohydrate kinase n=1 Tax=Paracoccus aurantiacus TaxID=2599412 RepID=A0A5C6S3A2_9RHOB|nr:carbohydrate kinase [Paracoccus aurantiacus]TXB68746.1 carbohydrate kinase [Paracoccus aurantiacus]